MARWQDSIVGRRILAFLGAVPGASKEDLQAALEERGAAFECPLFAPSLPAGWMTYESRLILTTTQVESDRLVVRFNDPVLLVGLAFIVTLTGQAEEGTLPELDELDVRIDMSHQKEHATARLDQASGSVGPNGFAPASSLDIRFPRFLMKVLPEIDAEVGFTFKGRYATSTASGFDADLLISAIAIAKPLNDFKA